MIDELELCLCIGATARTLADTLDQIAARHNLSAGQAVVLLAVARCPGCTQVAYSSALVINDATLTRYIDRLEDAGLIERQRGREDRRVVRLHLTQTGQAMAAEISGAVSTLEKMISDDMGATVFDAFSASSRDFALALAKLNRAS